MTPGQQHRRHGDTTINSASTPHRNAELVAQDGASWSLDVHPNMAQTALRGFLSTPTWWCCLCVWRPRGTRGSPRLTRRTFPALAEKNQRVFNECFVRCSAVIRRRHSLLRVPRNKCSETTRRADGREGVRAMMRGCAAVPPTLLVNALLPGHIIRAVSLLHCVSQA